jgi:nucleoside-diphosphate-sugar epimerase
MGPTLAVLAQRAMREAGAPGRVIGAARFSEAGVRERLEAAGIETISCDLLDDAALAALPKPPDIIYLAGRKFGASGNPSLTWAINTYLPGRVAGRFARSRIVALSTGNVYPLTPIASPGPGERDAVGPVGEYAQSCLGRERMFEYMSERHGARVALIRLNYAIDLRYGVLLDLAQRIWNGEPIDLTMGYVNVIWQGDANEIVLRCLEHAACPPMILNVTGPQVLRVRELAYLLGERLGKPPVFTGQEAPTALLSNAARCVELMGPPRVSVEQMLDWVAHWVRIGGPTLAKPTHFQTRDGKF